MNESIKENEAGYIFNPLLALLAWILACAKKTADLKGDNVAT